MKGYEAIAERFIAEGTRVVFNVMGDGNKLWLADMSRRTGVGLINARHEAAALTMADGYSRASGDVGICSVTYSTGLTQIATSLAVAARHGSPLVVFAADIPAQERGYGSQIDLDVQGLVTACGGVVHHVRAAGTADSDVRWAFHRARTERRPVVLLADPGLQEAEVPAPRRTEPPSRAPMPRSDRERIRPDPAVLGAAVDVIARAERPLVLIGGGAIAAGAVPAARELARAIGGLLATTLPAKGCVDDDPFNVGIAGSYSDRRARQLLPQADCVVALGASMNRYTRAHGQFFGSADVVRIDDRADRLLEWPDSVFIQADALIGAAELAAALPAERPSRWRDDATQQLLRGDPRAAEIEAVPARPTAHTLDPRRLVCELDTVLPANCDVLIGVGNFTTFPVQFLTNPGNRRFHTLLDFITIGQALPAALGAALGVPDRPVVAFEGDASFMMHVQELETAARYAVPLLLFVMNDGALGAEYHKLKAHGISCAETVMPTPDICELAGAFGVRARRLSDLQEVGELGDWFDRTAGPHVVDCPINRDIVGEL